MKGKIEQKRLLLQAELDRQKTQEERNKSGQFATPTQLANDIVSYGVSLLGKQKIKFLDPGIGTGSFYSALRESAPARQIISARGFEIDAHYGRPAVDLWKRHKLSIEITDFTRRTPKRSELANLLICNPPYVRHHHLGAEHKSELQLRTDQACGVWLNGLSGLYCYFMGLSHGWMEPGAIAGWLIPSEFMDVNYGRQLKRYLTEKVTLLRIHRFDPNDVQFDDALVSSAVVWLKNTPPPADHKVSFTYGGTLMKPDMERDIVVSELTRADKWTIFPKQEKALEKPDITLGDLFQIKRGLATGDNSFFIMTSDEIEARGLPKSLFRPVLPGTRHITQDVITSDEEGVPSLDRQLFLLDIDLPEDILQEQYPKLWAYLQEGKEGSKPVAERYLCRKRKPWYVQEKRPPAPIICTYMGRPRNGARPFRFILNNSDATATNVYLMLYPKDEIRPILERNPRFLEEIWNYLNSVPEDDLLASGRVYGGGLHKLEPKELRGLSVDRIRHLFPELTVSEQSELFDVA